MNRKSKEEELANIRQDNLLCDAFNIYLSLPTFPLALFFDRKNGKFYQIASYDQNHNDKQYQPVYTCYIGDIVYIKSIISQCNYHDIIGIIKLASFYQSSIFASYIFITSLNKFLQKPFKSWCSVQKFFDQLKSYNGYLEYLCWLDLFQMSDKQSFQDIRLKYFRPNQINFISVPFLDNRGDLMEHLLRNIASYWYPRLCNHLGEFKEFVNRNQPELRQLSLSTLEELTTAQAHKLMISTLSYEDLSGHVFQTFLLDRKQFQKFKYLSFLKECFTFYDGFSYDTVDILWAKRSAMKIITKYLLPGSKQYIYIPSHLLTEIKNASNPPYEDLFDSVIEYALFVLVPYLIAYFEEELKCFETVSEESFTPPEVIITEAEEIEDSLVVDSSENRSVPRLNEPTAEEAKPESKDTSVDEMGEILRNRNVYERFRQFLHSLADKQDQSVESPISPITDLDCYIDVEKFKLAKGKQSVRDNLATNIKQKYFTKKYFFGPASPASRNVQVGMLGGSGRKMPARPPSPVLLEVQKHVLQRITHKWLKQYKETEDYQRRSLRSGTKLTRRVSTRTDNTAYAFMDTKARANAHDMMQLRKTLMNCTKSASLKRYAKAKGDRYLRDIEFWVEVQKYKDMHHRHSSQSLIRKKIDTIIDCFLDSAVPPRVQISVPAEVASKTAQSRYELGPYLFRQVQSLITKNLCTLWSEYNLWCDKYEHQPLPFNKLELETQQKRLVKQLLRQKQKDEDKERQHLDYLHRRSSMSSKRMSRQASVASSIATSTNSESLIRPVIEEELPTLHWKFSDTLEKEIGEKEKRDNFLLKNILDKGMFKDDEGFRKYLTGKLNPAQSSVPSQIFYKHSKLSKSGRSDSVKHSFDSSASAGSTKSITRIHSRSNFDRTQLVSISEKLTVPSRKLKRRTAVSLDRRNRTSSASSVFSAASGVSLLSMDR